MTVIRPFTQSRLKIEQGLGHGSGLRLKVFGENVFFIGGTDNRKKILHKKLFIEKRVLTSNFYEFCVKATWRDNQVNAKKFAFDFVSNYTESPMGMGEASTNRQVGQRLLTSPSFAEIRK